MFTRRSRLCRDDYKPEKVNDNLRSGRWVLSSQVKRHGFVEILEDGEKIGLVMCASCGTTCSKNSFRKIRTHECGKSSPNYHPSKARQILERLAHAKHQPVNNIPSSSSSLFPIPLHLQPEQMRSPPMKDHSIKMERMEARTFSRPIEDILSKMVGDIQQQQSDDNLFNEQQPSPPTQVLTPRISPPIQLPKQLESIPVNSRNNNKSNSSDGDSLCNMVNSTYRTLSAQNRRLAIEFKCHIMNLISEYEMMMLSKEGNSNSTQ